MDNWLVNCVNVGFLYTKIYNIGNFCIDEFKIIIQHIHCTRKRLHREFLPCRRRFHTESAAAAGICSRGRDSQEFRNRVRAVGLVSLAGRSRFRIGGPLLAECRRAESQLGDLPPCGGSRWSWARAAYQGPPTTKALIRGASSRFAGTRLAATGLRAISRVTVSLPRVPSRRKAVQRAGRDRVYGAWPAL